ncbi:MAG: damage-inducible protein DinB [Acidobacteria bacterium]|nr:MAG: damage-inducible protein DinB [Acidobacteriota bacterium]
MATIVEQDLRIQAAVAEFREEASTTKRVLDRVPGDKLTWKPHEKSMSLGQLASHVATVPGGLARILQQDSFDVMQGSFVPPQPKNLEEILSAYDQSMRDGEQFLSDLTPQQANAMWHLRKGNKELFARPRIEVVRTIMLNHWYHHRGQLSVYLRLLEVPVPVIYGRSADEDPFA